MPKQRLQYGQLSQEDIDFLKARVDVKLCPDCNLKGEFKIIDGIVTVDNICCRKFAVTIGDSLSIKNINNYAVTFRGKILNRVHFGITQPSNFTVNLVSVIIRIKLINLYVIKNYIVVTFSS